MTADSSLISLVSSRPLTLSTLQRAGITEDYFSEPWDKAYRWILRMQNQHGTVPSAEMIESRFGVELHRASSKTLPILLSQIKDQKKYRDFGNLIQDAARAATGPEVLDEVIPMLQGQLNSLAVLDQQQGVVDLFSKRVQRRMMRDFRLRRRGEMHGIPTGLKRLDMMVGGLQKRRMCVVMARPGVGKSWIDLLFIANAVLTGHKAILFPLEMTLEETAYRLYTIFSAKMQGHDKALRNLDLTLGRTTPARVRKFLNLLEDRFAGQLYVADIGSITDPYTVERVEAEVALHKPDIGWIDYITLMKGPPGRDKSEDHTTIKALSNGVKGIAQRNDCVMGASAQVNRDSLRVKGFLPRVEHVAYGDAIGQDADHVISLNKRSTQTDTLYYAVVKNRHGPEIGKTRVNFKVDSGQIEEASEQDEEEDD